MLKTGAEIVIECLLEQGVEVIFGYPGGTILNIYDALYKYNGKIKHILTSHEQGASHAADGYARSTGKVGVCFATSGPGSTNLTTGIATAYMDSSPVVFITCNVGEDLLDRDSFQEVKMTSITKAITKCNYLVKDVNKLAEIIREAFYVAQNGRPGPVVIDILKNVTAQSAEYEAKKPDKNFNKRRLATNVSRPTYTDKWSALDEKDLDRAAKMINDSKRPLIVCGGGVVLSRANKELTEFANKIDAPVAFTVMGCGGYDGEKERATGLIGMHGTQSSNVAVANCDLLIVVGCRFSDRVALNRNTFAKQAQILQIEIDRNEIDKNVKTTYHVVGDAKKVLEALMERVTKNEHKAWVDFVFSFPTETEYEFSDKHLNPKQIAMAVKEIAPKYSIVTTDVGQHQMWAIQHFHYHYPGQLITSGGFGTMGFGLGAAIGAKVGNPDQTILHITGDGSFRMNFNELATEEHYHIPIITIIFNNEVLGMVRQWQNIIYNKHYSETILDRGPDFVKLAESFGLKGRRVTNEQEFRETLEEAVKSDVGYVIDCVIGKDEMVRPMVGAGSDITDFLIK